MITKDNLKDLLLALGFTENGNQLRKTFADTGAYLVADLKQNILIYPEDQGFTINERQTCNLSANENFVVFECVHRLLDKGYKPQHIELEPKWKLGHGASGGRADVLIKDNNGDALLIIECKTPGREFDKAWRSTLQDGDQLFSYAQQISETQFLCLYASDFTDGKAVYQSHIIAHRDNEKYLADNPQFKGFKQANNVEERFAVWRDTYKLDYTSQGIFETNIQPYHIGKDKYTLDDLRTLSANEQQKKYHEFATILRQHNVSGRENAFDKLVNLFLCKLVDETENPQDLKFYWKGVAYDTHFELLDRLQQLYQAGMKEFLGEDITYINRDQVFNAMRFIRNDLDATQRAVWDLFIQQKFFTNNDFSFIDVHNRKLFYQNAEVLLKLLQMWQDIRLTGGDRHNQFLGDMFEGFLDQGVKQSEGQFFTPMPICRFILMSLPLHSLIENSPQPPKAIDYACGAGHFLNELAAQIEPFILAKNRDPSDYHKAIFGIEKEYRLSKVAKVSAFMYGQRNINICYGDALVNRHDAFPEIQDHSFDLLVANPPYSVRGFLETLPEAERSAYTLTNTINDAETANSIETFFIERAKQLLKAGGVAAIILPSSILSNGGNTYVKAREILLQYFDIVAIAEFGSGTFGKTGTNTVTLFLRRKPTAPDSAEHYRERVNEWFNADENQGVYQDANLYQRYARHIGVESGDYRGVFSGQFSDALLKHETFTAYRKAFDASTEIVNLKKQKGFQNKPADERHAELDKRFAAFVQAIERDKLYHFILADSQPNPVLVIKSPSDTKAQKRFLGYEWSSAKGNEGIKLDKDAHGRHQTLLYDETRRDNPTKLNVYIAANFERRLGEIPAELSELATTIRLIDMLDFSRVSFEKQLSLAVKKSFEIKSHWPIKKLGEITEIINGGTPDTNNQEYWDGDICWATLVDTKEKYLYDTERKITKLGLKHTKLLPINTVIFSSRATIGEVCINKVPVATNQGYKNFVCNESLISHEYLYYALCFFRRALENLTPSGSKYKELNSKVISDFAIPLPPIDIQQKIVAECEAVDKTVANAQTNIAKSFSTIESLVDSIYSSSIPRQEIYKLSLAIQYGLSEKMNESGLGYKIFRMNEIIQGRMVDNGSMKYADISAEEFAKYKLNRGDVLFNRTNSIEHVGKTGLFEMDGDYCFASYLVRIVPDTGKILPLFLAMMMNSKAFQQEAKGKASKSINQANINATIMRNIAIPVPDLSVQEKFVAEIQKLEQSIAEAQAIIATAPAQKQAIMQKYL